MQNELTVEHPGLSISILGINQIGAEAGLPDVAALSNLPVVEDDETTQIWTNWGANWRDVIILDRQNQPIATYNLTVHNLAPGPTNGTCSDSVSLDVTACETAGEVWTTNYDYLKQLLIVSAQ